MKQHTLVCGTVENESNATFGVELEFHFKVQLHSTQVPLHTKEFVEEQFSTEWNSTGGTPWIVDF